jgi:hypothetical protein
VALPFTLKKYKIFKKFIKSIRQKKKNYGNSNISPCKEDIKIFKKKNPSKRNQNPSSSSELYNNKSQVSTQAKNIRFRV